MTTLRIAAAATVFVVAAPLALRSPTVARADVSAPSARTKDGTTLGDPPEIPPPPDVKAPPKDTECTKSGLCTKVLKRGSGTKRPGPSDVVNVHYTGWTTDGHMFDSSVLRGERAVFPLDRVIRGWNEGLQLMVEGEKRRLWIPANLAYGNDPALGRPAGMLVFDVELFAIREVPSAPPVPADVSAPPKEAKRTASGLAYRVLQKGSGTEHPSTDSEVRVHYTGWTTDGKMFDSSVARGTPAIFPLHRVIKGWTEGVQLMVEGEKTRFWIPAELAYGNTPTGNRPSGMLVFDIELLQIAK